MVDTDDDMVDTDIVAGLFLESIPVYGNETMISIRPVNVMTPDSKRCLSISFTSYGRHL